jgi:hypothetical protein
VRSGTGAGVGAGARWPVVVGGVAVVEAVCRSPLANAQNITPRNSRRANAMPAMAPVLMPSDSTTTGRRGSLGS